MIKNVNFQKKYLFELVYKYLAQTKNITFQLWGPGQFLTRWVLTGFVWPKVTYRAIV